MTPQSARFDFLDGIRAVAVGAVLGVHWLSQYTPFLHGGFIGVDVFFVLSGFIITTMLWRSPPPATLRRGWMAFIWRRVLRLYPALLGLVVGATLLFAFTPGATLTAFSVAERGLIALGQGSAAYASVQSGDAWIPSLLPFTQTWSLAIEWYFYLLWPIVIFACRARGVGASRVAGWAAVAAVALYLGSLPLEDFMFYFGPFARFAEVLVEPPLLSISRGTAPLASGAETELLALWRWAQLWDTPSSDPVR